MAARKVAVTIDRAILDELDGLGGGKRLRQPQSGDTGRRPRETGPNAPRPLGALSAPNSTLRRRRQLPRKA